MKFLSTLFASFVGSLFAMAFVLFLGFSFLLILVSAAGSQPPTPSKSVLVVSMSGDIAEFSSPDPMRALLGETEAATDIFTLTRTLARAAKDDRIKGVWLRFNGFQTGWAKLEELGKALRAFRDSTDKPLIASSSDSGFMEGEFFLASNASTVTSPPEAPFTFDGFYLAAEFYEGFLDKAGIEPQVVRAGKFKSAVEPYLRSDLSAENRLQLTTILDGLQANYVRTVARNRTLPEDSIRSFLNGAKITDALDAYETGLIDSLIYSDDIEEWIASQTGFTDSDDLKTISLEQYSGSAGEKGSDRIAVVYAEGTITQGRSTYSPSPLFGGASVGSVTFAEAVERATDDDRTKALVIRIDSPGGSAPASDAMWESVRKATEKMPVIVSMGNTAASGGYYMAAAADTIVADATTITGSIGVFGLFFDMSGLYEQHLGVSHDVVRSGPFADMYSGLRSITPAEQALLEKSVDRTYETFLIRVASGRGLSVETVDSLAQGRVWLGAEAKKAGLVDVVGTLDTAIQLAAQAADLKPGEYQINRLPAPLSFIQQLSGNLPMRLFGSKPTEVERWVQGQVRMLEELKSMHGTVQARLPFGFPQR